MVKLKESAKVRVVLFEQWSEAVHIQSPGDERGANRLRGRLRRDARESFDRIHYRFCSVSHRIHDFELKSVKAALLSQGSHFGQGPLGNPVALLKVPILCIRKAVPDIFGGW